MKEIRDWHKRFKELPAKSGPGCAAALILLAIFCIFIGPIQNYSANQNDNPFFSSICVATIVGGFFILYWICYFVNHIGLGLGQGVPANQLITLNGRWFLRRRGICFILCLSLCLWLISIPIRDFLTPKSDLTYKGQRLTEEEALQFLGDVQVVSNEFSSSYNLGKPFASLKLNTSPGRDLCKIYLAHDHEKIMVSRQSSKFEAEITRIGPQALASDSSLNQFQKASEALIAVEVMRYDLIYRILQDFSAFMHEMDEAFWRIPTPPYPAHTVQKTYRKFFQFIKGKERRYRNSDLVFSSSRDQQSFWNLRDTAEQAMRSFESQNESIVREYFSDMPGSHSFYPNE